MPELTPRNNRQQTPRKDRQRNPSPKREQAQQGHAPPRRAASEATLDFGGPLFMDEEFPKLHDTLSLSARRGRKDLRRSGRRGCQGEDEGDQARARSFSRSERTIEVSVDGEENFQVVGRARAYSTDRGLDALHNQSTPGDESGSVPAKGILKKRSSFGRNKVDNDDTNASGEWKTAAEELKASLERMASLLRKSQPHSDVDVESQLAAKLSQVLGQMGNEEEGNSSTGSSTGKDKLSEQSWATSTHCGPGGAASWEFPLSRNEKKARVIMLSAMENESLKEELDMMSRSP